MRAPLTDLRLLPAAAACWCAAAAGVRVPIALAVAGAGAALMLAAGFVASPSTRRGNARSHPSRAERPAAPPSGRRAGEPTRRASPPPRLVRARGHLALLLLVCAGTWGSCAAQREVRDAGLLAALAADGVPARVTGTVRSEAVPLRSAGPWGGEQERYRVHLLVQRVQGGGRMGPAAAPVLLLGGPGWRGVPYGAQVHALGTLERTGPGDDVVALVVVRGPPTVVRAPGPVDRRVARIRGALLDASDRLAADQRGLVPGAAIGDTSRVPADLDAAMRTAGLTHVTAVSGAHFAVVGAVVLALSAFVGLPRRLRAVVVGAAMAGFVVLVHPAPSVLRAAVMGAVGVWALMLGRPSRSVPALATCVLVLLLVDPWLATSIGFALSVAATAAIVLLTGPLAGGLARAVPERAARVLAVPVAAQCACGPLLVALSTGIPTYAVPANVLAAPAVAPATVLGLLAALLAPWWPSAGASCAVVAGWATAWLAGVARVVAGLPASELPWPAGPAGPVLLAAASCGAVLAVTRRSRGQPR